jgi:hypothetical protein
LAPHSNYDTSRDTSFRGRRRDRAGHDHWDDHFGPFGHHHHHDQDTEGVARSGRRREWRSDGPEGGRRIRALVGAARAASQSDETTREAALAIIDEAARAIYRVLGAAQPAPTSTTPESGHEGSAA